MKKFYWVLLLVLCGTIRAFGSHMLGGEITYKYLGSNGPTDKPFRYQIHFVAYIDRVNASSWPCGSLGAITELAIYDKGTLAKIPWTPGEPNYPLPNHPGQSQDVCTIDPYSFSSIRPVIIKKPVSCIVPGLDPAVFSIAITDTIFEVQLPFSASGYYIKYENNARTQATTNLNLAGQPGNTWLAEIPSPIFINSSPQFLEDAVPFFCNGDTATIANNATDPDGDRLIYSFVQPYSGDGAGGGPGNQNPKANYVAPELTPFATGYSISAPFGAGGYAFINPSTGLTKYFTNASGNYAIAIEIQEYRTLSNGAEILISTTRREFLVVVKDCAPNDPPTVEPPTFPGGNGFTLTITEGDSASFNLSSNDVDTTTISVISDLISGTNGYVGSLASAPSITGVGLVTTRFKWKADCGLTKGQVRSFPVNVKYEDRGCPPKIINVIYTIIVNPFKAPAITGKDTICSTDLSTTFTAPAGTGRKWKLLGGNILGIDTGNAVNFTFAGDTARIRLVVTSGLGCKDSTSKKISKVQFVPILATAPSAFVCQDSITSLNATGGYTSVSWLPATGLSFANIRNPILTISDTAQYIVTSNGPGGCIAKDTVDVKWIPRVANAGSDSILCSGLNSGIGAEQSTNYNFYHYSWTPSIGVLSDTSFKTNVSLTNSGQTVQTFTFVQTATHRASNCKSTDTVRINVKPLPIVNAGPDTATICSGAKTLIGTIESASATYSWDPAVGLVSPTNDTSTVSLINDTQIATLNKYKLTKTEVIISPLPGEPSCANTDSIWVKVNPLPEFAFSSNDSICSGFSTNIGTDNLNGFSYQWSPTQGLDHPDSSRTAISLTNLTQNPGDTIYTLTVTNGTTTCLKGKEITFRVNPLPLVSAGIDTAFCSGDSIHIGELDQTGFSYAWTPGTGLNTGSLGNPKISLINPNTGGTSQTFQYKLLKTNNRTTCKNADSLNVTVKPLPIANAAATDSLVVCSKLNIQLGENGLPNHLYTWVPDSALNATNISNPLLAINNPTQQVRIFKYTVNVTNSISTCKNSDSVFVKVNPLPIVPLSYSDTSVCTKDTILIGGAGVTGYTYEWSPKAQLSDSTIATTRFTAINNTDSPVNYILNLLVTINSTTCKNSKQLTIQVNPLPDANAGPDKEVCSKDSIQIGLPPITGRKYLWSPVTGLSNPNIANPKVGIDNPGATNQTLVYTLTVTDTEHITNCDSSDQVTITIKPLPVAFAAASDTVTSCSTVGINLGTTATTGLNYSWFPVSGLTSSTASNPVLTLTSLSALGVKYKLTVVNSGNSCQNFDSVYVKINPLPIVSLGTTDSLCSGDTITIGPGPITSPYTYLWTPATGQIGGTAFNPIVNLSNTGSTTTTQPYKLLVTDQLTGCRDSSTLSVRINPLPVVMAGIDKTICSGETIGVGFDNTVLGLSFAWLANPGLNLTNISNPTFTSTTSSNPKNDTLTLTGVNTTTQCKSKDEVIVTTNPRPEPMTFGPFSGTVCPFTPNVNYSITNSIAGNTYQWLVTGGAQISGTNTNAITVNWAGPNTGAKVVVIPTNSFGCLGTKDSLAITLNQNLNPPKPLGDSVLCSYFKTGKIYTTIPTPGSNYTWKLFGASVDSTVTTDGQTSVDWIVNDGIVKIWIQQQSNTIDPVTMTPVQCYGKSDTLNIQINPSPDSTLSINGLGSVCSTPGRIDYLSLNGSLTSAYAWTILPDASITTGQGTDSIGLNWSTPGNYVVNVLETSNKGCIGRPISKGVVVNKLPHPALTSASGLNICPNDLGKNYTAFLNPDFPNSTFLWTVTGGDPTTPTNATDLGVNWNANGNYVLKLTETTAQGCVKDTVLPLNYDPSQLKLTNVSLTEPDDKQVVLSFSMTSTLTNPSTISIKRREFGTTDWTVIKTEIPNNTLTYFDPQVPTDQMAFEYMIESQNVCARAIESNRHNTILLKVVAMQQEEGAKLNWNPYMGWAGGVQSYEVLRAVENASLTSYDANVSNDKVEMFYQSAADGFNQCWRIVANENQGENQSLSNTVCVKFENLIEFYTMITPNGDHKNDELEIKNLHLYPQNELKIFDRWGKKVFDKSNYHEGDLWKADDIKDGVYFYQFSVPGRSLEYNGWLNVIH